MPRAAAQVPWMPAAARAAMQAAAQRTAGMVWRVLPPVGRSATRVWWLHPLACVAMVAAVYALFPAFDYTRVVPTAYIPGPHYAWGAALLAGLAIGIAAVTVGREHPAAPPGTAVFIPAWATFGLLASTLVAYAIWFQPMFAQPALLLEVLGGRRMNLRDVAPTTPGVTTMTQFGVAYVVAHAVLHTGGARRMAWWEHAGLAAVFALGALRALAWSERLAVIELALTWFVARLAFVRVRSAAGWSLFTWLPVAAPLLLYLAFTGTEYFRSWGAYRYEYGSIWEFGFDRLLSYYATASNNGIGLLVENRHWPEYTGRYVAEWLYLMPVIGDELRASVGDVRQQYSEFMRSYARNEFNNPSGLFPIVFDIGYAGSMLYFVVVGALSGRLWSLWRAGRPAGVLFYPIAVLFFFELLRFNYLAASRGFPVILALVFLATVAKPAAAPIRR